MPNIFGVGYFTQVGYTSGIYLIHPSEIITIPIPISGDQFKFTTYQGPNGEDWGIEVGVQNIYRTKNFYWARNSGIHLQKYAAIHILMQDLILSSPSDPAFTFNLSPGDYFINFKNLTNVNISVSISAS